ncbi:hypothetical protein KLEP7_gp116 [Pseudaeromonas phage vB_PpeM_ KLEP7]|nr:hypothetical protein KLEP7_gp116 [Pseudaeromonas phage vB_PpeM_ KLEP7]
MNNEQAIKHLASQLFEAVDEEHLNLSISYFKDEDDGVDIFMSLCFYVDSVGIDEDYKVFLLSYWNKTLEEAKSRHKLAKDVILDMFWKIACSYFGRKAIHLPILSKLLDYCLPF